MHHAFIALCLVLAAAALVCASTDWWDDDMRPVAVAQRLMARDELDEFARYVAANPEALTQMFGGARLIHWATLSHPQYLRLLISVFGQKVNERDAAQQTPFSWAMMRPNAWTKATTQRQDDAEPAVDMVEVLLALGGDPLLGDMSGQLPMHRAAEDGLVDRIKTLQRLAPEAASKSVRAADSFGQRPLHTAAMRPNGHPAIPLLIELGSPLLATTNKLHTPLHLAYLNREAVEQLLAGARKHKKLAVLINAPDENGQTVLHYSASAGKLDIVRLLVDAGADLSVRNNLGLTPLAQASNTLTQLEALPAAEQARAVTTPAQLSAVVSYLAALSKEEL